MSHSKIGRFPFVIEKISIKTLSFIKKVQKILFDFFSTDILNELDFKIKVYPDFPRKISKIWQGKKKGIFDSQRQFELKLYSFK